MINSIQLLRIGLAIEIIGALLLAVDLFTDQYQDKIEETVSMVMIIPNFIAASAINTLYLLILFGGLFSIAVQFTSADIPLLFIVETQIFDEISLLAYTGGAWILLAKLSIIFDKREIISSQIRFQGYILLAVGFIVQFISTYQ